MFISNLPVSWWMIFWRMKIHLMLPTVFYIEARKDVRTHEIKSWLMWMLLLRSSSLFMPLQKGRQKCAQHRFEYFQLSPPPLRLQSWWEEQQSPSSMMPTHAAHHHPHQRLITSRCCSCFCCIYENDCTFTLKTSPWSKQHNRKIMWKNCNIIWALCKHRPYLRS